MSVSSRVRVIFRSSSSVRTCLVALAREPRMRRAEERLMVRVIMLSPSRF